MSEASYREGTREQALDRLTLHAARLGCFERVSVNLAVAGSSSHQVLSLYDRRTLQHATPFTLEQHLGLRQTAFGSRLDAIGCADIFSDPNISQPAREHATGIGIRAVLDAPLMLDGTVVGYLAVRYSRVHHWTTEEHLFAIGLANLAVLTLQRSQRQDAEQVSRDRSALLARQQAVFNELLRRSDAPSTTLGDSLRPLTMALVENMGIERSGIWLFDDRCEDFAYAETFAAATHSGGKPDPALLSRAHLASLLASESTAATAIEDCATHPATREVYDSCYRNLGITSTLRSPIIVAGERVGFITASTCFRRTSWTHEQISFIVGMANLAALAVERGHRRSAELSLRTSQTALARQQTLLTNLLTDTDLLTSTLPDALERLLKVLGDGVQADRTALTILAPEGGGFSYHRVYKASTRMFERPMTLSNEPRLAAIAHLATGKILIADDVRTMQRELSELRPLIDQLDIRSLLRIPVIVSGQNLGVLYLSACQQPRKWTAETQLFAMAIGNLVALAVEREHRRLAETRISDTAESLTQKHAVLNTLLRSDDLRHGDLPTAMRALARTFANELDIDRAAISIVDQTADTIDFAEAFVRGSQTFAPAISAHHDGILGLIRKLPIDMQVIVDNDPLFQDLYKINLPSMQRLGVKSVLQFPITLNGRVVGVINAAATDRKIEWTPQHKLFGTALANLAALVVERDHRRKIEDQLAAGTRILSRQQAVLNQLLRSDSVRTGSRNVALRELARTLALEAGIDRVAITVVNDARDAISFSQVFVLAGNNFAQTMLQFDPHPVTIIDAIERGQLTALDDLATRGTTNVPSVDAFYHLLQTATDVRSLMQVPIEVEGVVIGAMHASMCGRSVAWSSEQKLFATAISGIAALVIERENRRKAEAAIVESADRLSRQQTAINDLMRAPEIRTGTLHAALRVLSRAMCTELKIDRVAIQLIPGAVSDLCHADTYVAHDDAFVEIDPEAQAGLLESVADGSNIGVRAIADVTTHPSSRDRYQTSLGAYGIRSTLHVPIAVQGTVVGIVLGATCYRTMDWHPEQEVFAVAIAQLAALAVERHQRLRVENSLRLANTAVAEASRAKSLFLAHMSHEIRTPMNGVFGMTDLLQQTQLTERQSRLVGTINQSATTLLTIINDILDLSRIETGKLELDRQPMNLRDCLEGAIELFIEDARRKKIDLTFFMSQQTPDTVSGDPVRLRQVFVNLIGNALKFTAVGSVSVQVDIVGTTETKANIRFRITDTGIGISPDLRASLFQPFAQADSSISRRFGGTGLGLSISRHLVQLMGGDIDLTSAISQGTTVTFEIAFDVIPADAANAVTPAASIADKQVLLIDPCEVPNEILQNYLSGGGVTVTVARNVAHARDIWQAARGAAQPIDAAILDLSHTGLNTDAEIAEFSASPSLQALPLIVVTSTSRSAELPHPLRSGANHVLAQPLRRGHVLVQPLRRGHVLATLAAAIANEPAIEDDALRPQSPTRRKIITAHVLVAEDNPVNEEVAREYLQSLGCTIEVARNGLEAVSAFKDTAFDLILMDCQMPEMDGLSATRAIRTIEQTSNRPTTPIVAVTANAFAEDRIACLAAGMDDFLSKPFSELQLVAAIVAAIPHCVETGSAKPDSAEIAIGPATAVQPAQAGAPTPSFVAATPANKNRADLDTAAMTRLRADKPELFEKMLTSFLTHAPGFVNDLIDAAENGNVSALRLAAHSLKSASANVGASHLAALARQIEIQARSSDPDQLQHLSIDLRGEFDAIGAQISRELVKLRTPA
jgi:two-component system, sensor histidine kinase and response regulator